MLRASITIHCLKCESVCQLLCSSFLFILRPELGQYLAENRKIDVQYKMLFVRLRNKVTRLCKDGSLEVENLFEFELIDLLSKVC